MVGLAVLLVDCVGDWLPEPLALGVAELQGLAELERECEGEPLPEPLTDNEAELEGQGVPVVEREGERVPVPEAQPVRLLLPQAEPVRLLVPQAEGVTVRDRVLVDTLVVGTPLPDLVTLLVMLGERLLVRLTELHRDTVRLMVLQGEALPVAAREEAAGERVLVEQGVSDTDAHPLAEELPEVLFRALGELPRALRGRIKRRREAEGRCRGRGPACMSRRSAIGRNILKKEMNQNQINSENIRIIVSLGLAGL